MTTQSIESDSPNAGTTVRQEDAARGQSGEKQLASGKTVAMRMWEEQPGDAQNKKTVARDYETVGYVIEGRAELSLEGEQITLEQGMSWVVPANSEHSYRILEPFRAVEATSPPARNA